MGFRIWAVLSATLAIAALQICCARANKGGVSFWLPGHDAGRFLTGQSQPIETLFKFVRLRSA